MKETQEIVNFEEKPTDVAAKTIKAIDKGTVHRICSGQVVLTLATAVKELVENSLDAGATSIDIRLKDHGSTLIEVSDNGKGVEPPDFPGLTLKHHTSKLQDFGDLIGVKTFGFRGEALSSLCALSDLSIVTRNAHQPVGTKLVYDLNGLLTSQVSVSRQVGTTVSLQNLFHTLPVRHKEFLRNLKKEFNKMAQVLYSYCIISTNVRISCTNQTENGKRTAIVSTGGHSTIKENISSIFGAKQVSSLLDVKKKAASEEYLSEFGISNFVDLTGNEKFEFEGLISSCAHGLGRSAADRQFFFINARPCDPTKVSRIVNEVYHYYNRHQFPCVVLNIIVNSGDVDVNVTPDKRQIFLNQEKILLATLKTSLMALYENVPSTFDVQTQPLNRSFSSPCTPSPSTTRFTNSSTPNNHRIVSLNAKFSRSPSNCSLSGSPSTKSPLQLSNKRTRLSPDAESHSSSPKQPKLDLFVVKSSSVEAFVGVEEISTSTSEIKPDEAQNHDMLEEMVDHGRFEKQESSKSQSVLSNDPPENFAPEANEAVDSNSMSPLNTAEGEREKNSTIHVDEVYTPSQHCKKVHSKTDSFLNSLKARKSLRKDVNANEFSQSTRGKGQMGYGFKAESSPERDSFTRMPTGVTADPEVIYEEYDKEKLLGDRRKSLTVSFSLLSLREKLERKKAKSTPEKLVRLFRATISPSENQSAEGELKKEIGKDMFAKMEILGQFNLGFIITKLGKDLFIIDQHATDEKYNFETLQRTCILRNQRLIHPHKMELTAVNESVLMDNMEIFNKNGFEFVLDQDQPPGRRVKLVSMPHSHGWEFKREDVEELIFMLSDAPGVMCRPSRIRAMFASRACRKSVMIGTALSSSQMRKLIDHMGEIDQPWNCPHGRPTMRHLLNIGLISKA